MQGEDFNKEIQFSNSYCDLLRTALNSFVTVEQTEKILQEKSFTEDELLTLARYVMAKNLSSNVGEIALKTTSISVLKLFEEFGLKGKVVIGLDQLKALKTMDLVGGNIILEILNLVEENEKTLSEISHLSAKMKLPLLISFGRTLEEVGRLAQIYKCSPARMLEDFGFLDRKCSLLGCNFIDKDDLKLLADYDCQIVLSPRSDMMLGRGAVNLYTIENNDIRYSFANDANPIIDMLAECELARGNTANLLYQRGLISSQRLLDAIICKGKLENQNDPPLENIFNTTCHDENDKINFTKFKTETEKIIKEKLWK